MRWLLLLLWVDTIQINLIGLSRERRAQHQVEEVEARKEVQTRSESQEAKMN